jgi:Helicase conserved C-terminal domain/DEAD/DEAH box helicase
LQEVYCLHLRDNNIPEGIAAIIVYPMNALAEDQLGRLRELLAGTGVTFGMYVGKTPQKAADVTGIRLKAGSSPLDYEKAVEKAQKDKQPATVYPPEERASREELRKSPPRILLTNIKQLELLLTRQTDIELFNNVRLKFLVFDEAHTFSGATGAETACLIRRLRSFCNRNTDETTFIATSATIADPDRGKDAGRDFAARFFGIARETVELVGEQYQQDLWADRRTLPLPLAGNANVHLKNVLDAIEQAQDREATLIKAIFQAMTGQVIDAKNWQESLYDRLAANELVYQLDLALKTPRLLTELITKLKEQIGQSISEAEILVWLALGAASRKEKRPLLRPVIHGFVRGVGGAVVTFPSIPPQSPLDKGGERPQLWLSAEDTVGTNNDGLFRLPVTTCTTCGQHYFVHHVADFKFSDKDKTLQGGQAEGTRQVWKPLNDERGGDRVLLLDRLITSEEDERPSDHPDSTGLVFFCRHCGTLHSSPLQRSTSKNKDRCDGCGSRGELVTLLAVRQKSKHPGKLTSCITCQASGRLGVGGYREPVREVRAVSVSDVHVLAQNMIHHAERRRLLVFADNRQDAAFQAGWMQDHARRYRLRSLMYDRLKQGSVSIGDLTIYLDRLLDEDDDLSRSLIPEVWDAVRKESAGVEHSQERKYFLRIQILREISAGVKQRIGLEPWGRMRIDYLTLNSDLEFIQKWSQVIGVNSEELVNGIASLLDVTRRSNILLDREGRIFSKFWQEGDREIQRGYLPILSGVPKGLKLQRQNNDKQSRVQQWSSDRGQTLAIQSAQRWGIPKELVSEFLEELWQLLTEKLALLVPVTLTGRRDRALAGCAGVYQIDADKLRLTPQTGMYRCQVCRRVHLRPTPKMACMAWRCSGTIEEKTENPDDYDLMVLDQQFSMLRPREHSAQVPARDREVLETMFKGKNEQVNTLVCTPTLEMGVNIGSLDAVLMRNVPPLPANYWQRAGRAGRQHRMAVNLTYARQASHDRAYFQDPLKLLMGEITPPRFNLRNNLMIEKHVHATILTVLHQLKRSQDLAQSDREEIQEILDRTFPKQIKQYLFEREGLVRSQPLEVDSLNTLINKHETVIFQQIKQVFCQDPELQSAVNEEMLHTLITEMGDKLTAVIQRVWKRLQWALDQMNRLDEVRRQKATLDPDEESLRRRCDRLIKKLKGIQTRQKREAEGYDDINK